MKKILSVCVLGLLPLISTALLAEEAEQKTKFAGFELTGNLALTNDYVSRGISASDHGPAVQGTFNANHDSGFYVSLFASNVDFKNADGTAMELDPSVGYTKEWESGWSVDLGIIQYLYPFSSHPQLDPKTSHSANFNYREYYLGTGYKIAETSLKVKYYYSDDNMGLGNASSYLDTQLAYEIPAQLPLKTTLKGHYGLAFGDYVSVPGRAQHISNYGDYSLGVAVDLPAGFGAELDYIGVDSDGRALNKDWQDDGRLVLSLTKSF
ncbi:MAG: hypothetical protein HQL87_13945 [Magnetococcales bacterium]|nr:hypothetical protein [Magnetococcales bacterium]